MPRTLTECSPRRCASSRPKRRRLGFGQPGLALAQLLDFATEAGDLCVSHCYLGLQAGGLGLRGLSAKLDADTFACAVRSHWGTENRLHWMLDVVFHNDLACLRTGHGPANMAVVKHMALNLLRQAKSATSLKNRRKRAGWNKDYLAQAIQQTT